MKSACNGVPLKKKTNSKDDFRAFCFSKDWADPPIYTQIEGYPSQRQILSRPTMTQRERDCWIAVRAGIWNGLPEIVDHTAYYLQFSPELSRRHPQAISLIKYLVSDSTLDFFLCFLNARRGLDETTSYSLFCLAASWLLSGIAEENIQGAQWI